MGDMERKDLKSCFWPSIQTISQDKGESPHMEILH